MKTLLRLALLGAGLLILMTSCNKDSMDQMIQKPIYFRSSATPQWAKDATIYEVNLRQYTPEGTFNAFSEHLPRLKEMGIKILWLMPIHPISATKRKGILGSFYAVSDYRAINPEFGTLQDFKALVRKVHELDMKLILDWVPNHTGWDHIWLKDNPDYYTTELNGQPISPKDPKTGKPYDWTDVVQLDFGNPNLRDIMIEEMLYWLQEAEIDGYRCDRAAEVPDDFWLEAVPRLREAKPDIFLLAESEHSPHRNLELFAATYSWSFHNLLNEIAKGEKNALAIDKWYKEDRLTYIAGYHMNFITNHDENKQEGSEFERMGDAVDAMAVLVATFDGIPMLYNGQEAALDKRLEWSEKDTIKWDHYIKHDFYKKLIEMKQHNPALWNGADGGQVQRILADNADIYAFFREKNSNKVLVILNLSNQTQTAFLESDFLRGTYSNIFNNSITSLPSQMRVEMKPWSYRVLSTRIEGL